MKMFHAHQPPARINKHLVGAQVGDKVLYNTSGGTSTATIVAIGDKEVTIKTGKTDKSLHDLPLDVDCDTIRGRTPAASFVPKQHTKTTVRDELKQTQAKLYALQGNHYQIDNYKEVFLTGDENLILNALLYGRITDIVKDKLVALGITEKEMSNFRKVARAMVPAELRCKLRNRLGVVELPTTDRLLPLRAASLEPTSAPEPTSENTELPRRWHKFQREEIDETRPLNGHTANGCDDLRERINKVAKLFDDPFKFLGIVPGDSRIPKGPTQTEALHTRQTIPIPCQWLSTVDNKVRGTTNVQYSNGQLLNRLISAVEKGEHTGVRS